MPLVISLKNKTSIPVEVDTVRLEIVRTQSTDAIRETPVQYGNKQVPLGEFFDVEGSAAEDDEMVWQGDLSHVKYIGAHASGGTIRVEGNAGMHLGAEMTAGEIIVSGNVADWVGAEMHGGHITIHGNAGHMVGAVYRGGRRGMTGGEIFVLGNVGNEVGHAMRRGLIAVGGTTGDAAGFGMIAGSLLLFGEVGIRPGASMRRGTIGLLGSTQAPAVLPTFKQSGTYQPVFLRVYLRHLQSSGFPLPEGCFEAYVTRYCGDFLENGKGEVLIRTL